jgi:hypothetical protein
VGKTYKYQVVAYGESVSFGGDVAEMRGEPTPEISITIDKNAETLYFFLTTDTHAGTECFKYGKDTYTVRKASLRENGNRCRIYVTRGTAISGDAVQKLVKAFDGDASLDSEVRRRGIHENDLRAFGNPPDVDGDPKLTIVIDEHLGSPNTYGYFWGLNENNNLAELTSAVREQIHVKADENWINMASTSAHEFQHCIHHRNDVNELLWVDEGCATLAQDVCDYFNSRCHDRLELFKNGRPAAGADPAIPKGWLESLWGTNLQYFQYHISLPFFIYVREREKPPGGEPDGQHPALRALIQNAVQGDANFPLQGPDGPILYNEIFQDWAVACIVNDDKFVNDKGRAIYDFSHGSQSSGKDINDDLRVDPPAAGMPPFIGYEQDPARAPGKLNLPGLKVEMRSQGAKRFSGAPANPGILCVNMKNVNIPGAAGDKKYTFFVCETGAKDKDRLMRREPAGGEVKFRLAGWGGYDQYGHFNKATYSIPCPQDELASYDVEVYKRPFIMTIDMPWRVESADKIPVLIWYPMPEKAPVLKVQCIKVYDGDKEVASPWAVSPFPAYPGELAMGGRDSFFAVGVLDGSKFSFTADCDMDTVPDAMITVELYICNDPDDLIGDRRDGKKPEMSVPAVRRTFVVNKGKVLPSITGWSISDPYYHSDKTGVQKEWDFGAPKGMADASRRSIGLTEYQCTDYAIDIKPGDDQRKCLKLALKDGRGKGKYVLAYNCVGPLTAADAAGETTLKGLVGKTTGIGGFAYTTGSSPSTGEPTWSMADYDDDALYREKREPDEYTLKGLLAWNGEVRNRGECFLWDTDPFRGVHPKVAPAAGQPAAPSTEFWNPVDKPYGPLEEELDRYDELLQKTLTNTLKAQPAFEYAGGTFVRKLYLAGGSGACGDFNYTVQEDQGEASKSRVNRNAFGRVRTYSEGGLNGMRHGRAIATNGPLVSFDIDSDGNFESVSHLWNGKDPTKYRDEVNAQMGGYGKFDGQYTLVVNRARPKSASYHWLWESSDDFGKENPEVKAWAISPGGKQESQFAAPPGGGKKLDGNPFDFTVLSAVRWGIKTKVQGPAGDVEYRGYSNPMWVIPVTIQIFVDEVDVGGEGIMYVPAGKLRVHFTFDVSMTPKACKAEAHTVDDVTWEGPGGSMTDLAPDGGKNGWYDNGPVKNCIYKTVSHADFYEDHFTPSMLEHFFVFINGLQDHNQNPLNAVAEQGMFAFEDMPDDGWGYPLCDPSIVPSRPEDDMRIPENCAGKTVTGTYCFQGCGNPSGHMFDLILKNQTDRPISVTVPQGMVVKPTSQPADGKPVQEVIVSDPVTVEVPPGGTVTTPVDGYCLDRGKLAPPKHPGTQERPPVGKEPPAHFPEYEKVCESPVYDVQRVITVVAKKMGKEGKLKTPFDGDKAVATVAQWAIWKETSEKDDNKENDVTKDNLKDELYKQVEKSTGKKREDLSEKTKQKLEEGVDQIWETVNVCQKESREIAEKGKK